MNMYDRYLLRDSGEAKHQAQSPTEATVFLVLDILSRRAELFYAWKKMNKRQKNTLMGELKRGIERIMTEE